MGTWDPCILGLNIVKHQKVDTMYDGHSSAIRQPQESGAPGLEGKRCYLVAYVFEANTFTYLDTSLTQVLEGLISYYTIFLLTVENA